MSKRRLHESETHKKQINELSINWGKKKFTPELSQPAPVQDKPTPWSQVKNDILQDELEQRNSGHLDMESQQAKEFKKLRKQNYRRNVIETNRSEKTDWATFDDKNKWNKNRKRRVKLSTDPNKLSTEDRNTYRRKLTKGVCAVKAIKLEQSLKNLKHNPQLLESARAQIRATEKK